MESLEFMNPVINYILMERLRFMNPAIDMYTFINGKVKVH